MSKLNRRGVRENARNAERAPPKNGPDGVRSEVEIIHGFCQKKLQKKIEKSFKKCLTNKNDCVMMFRLSVATAIKNSLMRVKDIDNCIINIKHDERV